MSNYTKQFLSQSNNGKSITIAASGTNLTTIHTTNSSSNIIDEVWLYASNPTTSDVFLNLLYGGTSFTTDTLFEGVIEAYAGSILICPGLIAKGDGVSGFSIYGNSPTLSGVNVFGYVNRIS
jgi:hypothetical protein